ncbi:MAG: flagellar biosynthesis anti-sigma factor FlgM [Planctomycetes bacterium]|nr:flagellar biosynthesis anti-sigma factor FlgM [Planctomycetota bacterium]
MYVGNSNPLGPKPNDPKKSHLDPDLTRVNREGIERTSSAGRERMREVQREETAKREELRRSALSRESVELSSESRRLAAEELPGPGGARESADARAERIDELKRAYATGELNTPERARESAGRLLGGE